MKTRTYLIAGAAALGLLFSPMAASAAHHHHGHGWNNNHMNWHGRHWRHGARVPFGWRHYAWFDWRRHHLHDPGRYHWVFVDDQYLLLDDRGLVIEIGGD
jgi:Ni/Co efflux regulator RcnB